MMQDQTKDDFLEAATMIFQKTLEQLFNKKSITLDENEKTNLLLDALKEVKKEHEVNINVIDKLIDNPEDTKKLFKELLDQKIKSKEQFIVKATEKINEILPKLSEEIRKDFEKVNTLNTKSENTIPLSNVHPKEIEEKEKDLSNEKALVIETKVELER